MGSFLEKNSHHSAAGAKELYPCELVLYMQMVFGVSEACLLSLFCSARLVGISVLLILPIKKKKTCGH